jgi:hypothetical protein
MIVEKNELVDVSYLNFLSSLIILEGVKIVYSFLSP